MSDDRVKPRSYIYGRKDHLYCVPGGTQTCNPNRFVHGKPEPGSFHDETLEQATYKINDILDEVSNTEPNRELAIITTPDGLFLAWVSEGDEDDVLRDILRIEPPSA